MRYGLIALCLFGSATALAEKPNVALVVAGPRAEELHGILFASVANAVELVAEEKVEAALDHSLKTPVVALDFEAIENDSSLLSPLAKATREMGANALVIVKVVQQDRLHHTITVAAVGANDKHLLLRRVFELRGKGRRPGYETFDYKMVKNAVYEFCSEFANQKIAQR